MEMPKLGSPGESSRYDSTTDKLPPKEVPKSVADLTVANPMSVGMLLKGIQKMQNIYAGTVEPHVIAQRRAKNKVARKSRKINRDK